MRTFNRAMAARAAGLPYQALASGQYHGTRTPAAPHVEGQRRAEQWSMAQVLAVAVGRALQAKFGTPVEEMETLFNALWTAEESDLRAKFAAGRKYVMVVGRVPVGGVLFTEEEIARNDIFDYEAIERAGFPLPVGVDISQIYDRIAASLLLTSLDAPLAD